MKKLLRYLTPNKWQILGTYDYAQADYVVHARMRKNGLMQFKTVKAHGFWRWKTSFLPTAIVDTHKQWKKITGLEND